MENTGELYYKRGIYFFEKDCYEQAVAAWILAYELGYEREQILKNIYDCFISPNEMEFRNNYNNSEEFTQLAYDDCVLDFIPVSEKQFYIFDTDERKFQGVFVLDDVPVQGQREQFYNILYTNVWDVREMLEDMKENRRDAILVLLNKFETKFMSFFKLPRFKELYLKNVIVFHNEKILQAFLLECEEIYLPKEIVTDDADKYISLINEIHEQRVHHKVNTERNNIFLSVCIPSFERGTLVLNNVKSLLQCPYDSEIEIVVLNNGSVEDMQGYQEIQKLKDRRVRYYEFSQNKGKAIALLKTLEIARGKFAVLMDDQDLMNWAQLGMYCSLLKEKSVYGVLAVSELYQESVEDYKPGISAVYAASKLNLITGITFNMELYRKIQVQDVIKKMQDNAFVEEYAHTCVAMLLSKNAELGMMNISLWANANVDQYEDKKSMVLPYMLPESRIAQQNGFMEFCNKNLEFKKDRFVDIFMQRCAQTYFLIDLAYDTFDDFCKYGTKQRIHFWIYQEQIKYLSEFPVSLSKQEYLDAQLCLKQQLYEKQMKCYNIWLVRDNMNDLKSQIRTAIQSNEHVEMLDKLIKKYEIEYPMDLDLYSMKAWYYIMDGNLEEAYEAIKSGLRHNPYNYVANQIARMVCKETNRYIDAIKYDTILTILQRKCTELPVVPSWIDELMNKIMEQYHGILATGDRIQAVQYQEEIKHLEESRRVSFGLNDYTYYWEDGMAVSNVGTIYEDAFRNKKYNAYYNDMGPEDILPAMKTIYNNWVMTKLECLEVVKTKSFNLNTESEYLLPILQEENDKSYQFVTADGKKINCRNKREKHFEYYRLLPGTSLYSEKALYLGNPILMKQNDEKKKLVLNIFIEGLSQKVIEEENFEDIMPHTVKFFSNGIRCSNAYSTGEWTLPSLASYVSGVSSVNHMIIHNKLTNNLPEDITVLAEYFKEQGYQTAKIDGEWRSTQSYGYGRGMDRIIYQHQDLGMRVEQEIADVLDHLMLMKETNQFVWMRLGDLHRIADGDGGRASMQASIPLEYRSDEEIGVTSVKQKYSMNKRVAYIKQMEQLDFYLDILYQYIEKNYNEDEIVISLFGDHGQGYLVGDDEHFLAKGRSKVAMMFRGGIERSVVCKEIISTCDYLPIMCRMAGIPLKNEKIEGQLPVCFGGEQERECAITDSIHPGDLYRGAVFSKDYVLYFTSGGVVEYDGRFELGEYECQLVDKDGKECQNSEKKSYYFDILMKHIGSLIIY